MSKAPKASEALQALSDDLKRDDSRAWGLTYNRLRAAITAAERAEAEAAEGESVEGLMPSCASATSLVALVYDPVAERWMTCRFNQSEVIDGIFRGESWYATAHDAIRPWVRQPAAPDASWLGGASFEEMEKWLPEEADICETSRRYWINSPDHLNGPDYPTRTEAVRAFLREHSDLWSGKR